MIRVWYFLHLLGFTLWIGAGLASMLLGIGARQEPREALGAVVRGQAAIHRLLIAPGVLLTVLSGLILTFSVSGRLNILPGFSLWLTVMQGAGLVGALLALFISVPTAARLGRIDPVGPHAAYFDELRARQRIAGSVAGVFALVALVAGAMMI